MYNYTVHGFASVSYTVVETEQLTTTFRPNVKGNSPLGVNIGGEIMQKKALHVCSYAHLISNDAVCINPSYWHFFHCVPTTTIPTYAIASYPRLSSFVSHAWRMKHWGKSGPLYHMNDVKYRQKVEKTMWGAHDCRLCS